MATFTGTSLISSVDPENTLDYAARTVNIAPDVRYLSSNRSNLLVSIDDIGPTAQLEDKLVEYMG